VHILIDSPRRRRATVAKVEIARPFAASTDGQVGKKAMNGDLAAFGVEIRAWLEGSVAFHRDRFGKLLGI
jgi:hypothetical protein